MSCIIQGANARVMRAVLATLARLRPIGLRRDSLHSLRGRRLERGKGIEHSPSAWKIVGKPNYFNEPCVKSRPKTVLNPPYFYNERRDEEVPRILYSAVPVSPRRESRSRARTQPCPP